MSDKKAILDWDATGLNFYLMFRRESDGLFLNASGTFESSPSSYPAMTEHSVMKGRYEATITAALDDGQYTFGVKERLGGSQAPSTDPLRGTGEMWIRDDKEVALDRSMSSLNDIAVADIEASSVLAKEATVAARASQASLDAHEVARASMETALVAEHDATQAAVAAIPTNPTIQATWTDAKAAYLDAAISGRASQASVDGKPTLAQIEGSTVVAEIKTMAEFLYRMERGRLRQVDNPDGSKKYAYYDDEAENSKIIEFLVDATGKVRSVGV